MIIVGLRGVTYSKQHGTFYCPQCSDRLPYRRRRVRRFFTLYFIPVIPMDLMGDYVECQGCRSTFHLDVLKLDPEAANQEVRAEFDNVLRRTMVMMMLADGEIDDEEIDAIRTIYHGVLSKPLSAEEVHDEIDRALQDKRPLEQYLAGVAGYLNEPGKETVVQGAFLVAAADGEFHEDEKKLLATIAAALGMSPAHAHGAIDAMMQQIKGAAGTPTA